MRQLVITSPITLPNNPTLNVLIVLFRITRLKENGLIKKWLDEYYPRNVCADSDKIKGGQVATLPDIAGGLILFSFGILMAVLCLLMEICVNKRHFIMNWLSINI